MEELTIAERRIIETIVEILRLTDGVEDRDLER